MDIESMSDNDLKAALVDSQHNPSQYTVDVCERLTNALYDSIGKDAFYDWSISIEKSN